MKRLIALIVIVILFVSSIVLPPIVNAETSNDSNANATLVSSDWKASNGKINVTGTVVFSSKNYQRVGIVAIGYDKNGKAIETKSVDELQSDGKGITYKLVLDAGSLITRVEVKPTGNATDIVLLSSADRLENGKVIATGVVENGTSIYQHVGIVATGYDENNKPIETKCIDDSLTFGGANTFIVVLDSGAKIKRVVIKATGKSNDIELLSSAERHENGKVITTGVVENGTSIYQHVGIVATGYDENNKPIETKCIDDSLTFGGANTFKVVLDSGAKIKRVDVQAIGKANDIELLSAADRLENDKIIATASVENGTDKGQDFVLVATGYDQNGKVIETKSSKNSLYAGSSKSYSVVLTGVSQIKTVEVKLMVDDRVIKLSTINDKQQDKKENKKVIVTGTATNIEAAGQNIGIVATGYDENNKPVETKCVGSFESKGKSKTFSLELDAGSIIKRVEVKEAGNATSIELLSAADRLENGKVIVTGSVENGTDVSQNIGIVATGYDKNNKPVETKCISSYELKGKIISYKVVLDAGSVITRVEVKAAGDAEYLQLLSAADRKENGKVVVTGSVENGTDVSHHIGIVATGYDKNNKPVETKCISSYELKGKIIPYKVVLDAGSVITRVEVKATGEADYLQLLSTADRLENGKVIATASVENGAETGGFVTVIFTGYDGNKKVVEEKSQKLYINKTGCQSFIVTLNSGSKIKTVGVKIVEK